MKRILVVAAVVMVLLCISVREGRSEPQEAERPAGREQMEQVRKRIETLRMWKLTKALDLDEKTSAQLFPLLNRFDKRRAETESAMRDDLKALRETLRDGGEAKIKTALEKIEQQHEALKRLRDEEKSEVKKILSVRQQAEYILFMQEFDREIRKIIAESRERRMERRMERRGGERPERPQPPSRD